MPTWIIYAIFSMLFAGATAVLAKFGLQNIHPDLALGIRTVVIFVLVLAINLAGGRHREISLVTGKQLAFLALSAVTTTLSWLFYYRAVKEGVVSYVAAIDKGSVLITLLLSFLLLGEPVTAKLLVGTGFIFVGLLFLVK